MPEIDFGGNKSLQGKTFKTYKKFESENKQDNIGSNSKRHSVVSNNLDSRSSHEQFTDKSLSCSSQSEEEEILKRMKTQDYLALKKKIISETCSKIFDVDSSNRNPCCKDFETVKYEEHL
jgi:hypothetical protein